MGIEPGPGGIRAGQGRTAGCHLPDSGGHRPARGKVVQLGPGHVADKACNAPDSSGPLAEHNTSITADLEAVVNAWPNLSPETRARILQLVKEGGAL